MAQKERINLYIPEDTAARIKEVSNLTGTPVSDVLISSFNKVHPSVEAEGNRVQYLLRNSHGPDWKTGGGRHILDWFLLREPDWQEHHTVYLPRHWPLTVGTHEWRCLRNGGDGFPVNQEIATYNEVQTDSAWHVPSDFGNLTDEEWIQVCEQYRGCCGERIRKPGDPHWDDICDFDHSIRDATRSHDDILRILNGDIDP